MQIRFSFHLIFGRYLACVSAEVAMLKIALN